MERQKTFSAILAIAHFSATAAFAQLASPTLDYQSLDYQTYSTLPTGIRGGTLTVNYIIPGFGTGGCQSARQHGPSAPNGSTPYDAERRPDPTPLRKLG